VTAPPAPRNSNDARGLLDDVEFVLDDARERAQAIIDESTERARELIRQERAAAPLTGIDTHAFDDLRRGLRNLVTEVRDIQQRLGRIEQLIREQNEHLIEVKGAPVSPPAFVRPSRSQEYAEPQDAEPQDAEPQDAEPQDAQPQYAEPQYAQPQYAEPQYAEPQYAEPQYAEPQYAEPQYAEPGVADPTLHADADPGAPEPPSVAPPRTAFSVVPPQRREWTEPTEATASVPAAAAFEGIPDAPTYEPPAAPPRTYTAASAELAPDPAAWRDDQYDESSSPDEGLASAAPGSALVTFLPSDGAITLRVAPVAGFQGLMRIQDALTRIPAVRAASVDTYSQGEASVRIELAEASDSDEIVDGLARGLRSPARVEDASEVNRELFITLR